MNYLIVDRGTYAGRERTSIGIWESEESWYRPVVTYESLGYSVKLLCRDPGLYYLCQLGQSVAHQKIGFSEQFDLLVSF